MFLTNEDTIPQNNENDAVVPSPCSSPISVGRFQVDLFNVSTSPFFHDC